MVGVPSLNSNIKLIKTLIKKKKKKLLLLLCQNQRKHQVLVNACANFRLLRLTLTFTFSYASFWDCPTNKSGQEMLAPIGFVCNFRGGPTCVCPRWLNWALSGLARYERQTPMDDVASSTTQGLAKQASSATQGPAELAELTPRLPM